MFYDCGELKNGSIRLDELKRVRKHKIKEERTKDLSEKQIHQYFWRKTYNIYEMGNLSIIIRV